MSETLEFDDPLVGAPLLEMGEEFANEVFKQLWGAHPMKWKAPCQKKPRWWQRTDRRHEREMIAGIKEATGLTEVTVEMRAAYWREVRKGQGVFEDAGGYFARCWFVMLGFRTPEPIEGYGAAQGRILEANHA